MKKVFVILSILAFASVAGATGNKKDSHPHGNKWHKHNTSSSSNSTASAKAQAKAGAVATGGNSGSSVDFTQRDSASSSAGLMIAACTNGVSGQGMGGGAALALSDGFCKVIMMYDVAERACVARPRIPVHGGKCDPEQSECGTVPNPVCDDSQELWTTAKAMIVAETGAGNWRSTVGQYMPNFLRWLF